MKFKDELFSPYIFLIGFIIFFVIGIVGRFYFLEYFSSKISIYTLLYLLLISLSFIVGQKIKLNIQENLLIASIVFLITLFTFKRYSYFSILFSILGLLILYLLKKNIFIRYYIPIFIIGISICLINIIIIGKIPLINPSIRESSLTPLFVLGYTFLLISNNIGLIKEKYPKNIIFPVFSILLFTSYGFRTYIILLIISTMATLYLIGNKKKIIYFGIIGSILIIILGYLTILFLPQNWKLNPLELLLYRVTFTFDVFDKICTNVGIKIIGNYSLLTETTTGYTISEKILNYSHNITSTIFGPPIFDGGIPEVLIFTLFVSISLFNLYGKARKNRIYIPYYSLIISIFIVSIEISPYPLIILLIPSSLYISKLNLVNND